MRNKKNLKIKVVKLYKTPKLKMQPYLSSFMMLSDSTAVELLQVVYQFW